MRIETLQDSEKEENEKAYDKNKAGTWLLYRDYRKSNTQEHSCSCVLIPILY